MGSYKTVSILLVATFSFLVATVSSHNILMLMPIATKSETHLLNPIAKALLDRGHQVTLVTPATSSIKHNNFSEIVPVKPLDISDFDKKHSTVQDIRAARNELATLFNIDMSYVSDLCHIIHKHDDFQPVVQAKSYDLVLTSAFFSECFLGLIHKKEAAHVMLSSMPLTKFVLDMTGMRTPLSFVPNPFVELTDSMTLSERLVNTLSSWSFALLNYYHYDKVIENVYRQYWGADVPGVETLRKNVSMIFSNTHFSINFPRPLMPDVVEIGGVHCQPAKPLPKDLEEFVSGDKNGFIFFSLGTVFKEEMMTDSFKQMFINVFSRLNIRVLWKWKSDIAGLPKHVKVAKWLPQQDVLGHRNIKLFISHGGLLSTQESTYHGTPIIGLPLFVDQDVNMRQVEAHGYGMKLELLGLTEEILESSIYKMLNNTSYLEKARSASALFKDQPQTPLERTVYWMEYLVNHRGAPELRSHARNLSYFEYHLYDVQLILLAIVGTIVFGVWKIISKCLQTVWGKDDRSKRESKLAKKIK